MPGKHVRFAPTSIVHYPPTPVLSSTGALLNPPSCQTTISRPQSGVFTGPSPYAIPFTSSPNLMRLHALLQFSSSPLLNFDSRQSPSTITSHHQGIQFRALSEPATQPLLATINIIVPHLPWSLTVYPSHRRAFVTVEDVLEQLYHMLRTNISEQEFHSLPSYEDQRRVTTAYEQRYRRVRGSREYEDEKRRGVKRVDFLVGHTRFMGLSPSPTLHGMWILHTT